MTENPKIPEGMTEDEVMATINKVVNRLAYKYRFGYHDIDDIKQEGRLAAWKGLVKYDNKRPLENFLWTHVRNRLYNHKRDNFERPDLPCKECPFNAYDEYCDRSTSGCTKFEDKLECDLYARWMKRNQRKRNIMSPVSFDVVVDETENNMKVYPDLDHEIDMKQFFDIVETNIPLDLKADLIRLRNGITIPKPRREKLYQVIRDILAEKGLDEPETW